jgi:hypothetical protein
LRNNCLINAILRTDVTKESTKQKTHIGIPLTFQKHTDQKACQDVFATGQHTESGKIQPEIGKEIKSTLGATSIRMIQHLPHTPSKIF